MAASSAAAGHRVDGPDEKRCPRQPPPPRAVAVAGRVLRHRGGDGLGDGGAAAAGLQRSWQKLALPP